MERLTVEARLTSCRPASRALRKAAAALGNILSRRRRCLNATCDVSKGRGECVDAGVVRKGRVRRGEVNWKVESSPLLPSAVIG
jgi:hypothetical protein